MPRTEDHNEWDVLLYADGACLGNPGPGGWGALLIPRDGAPLEKSGLSRHTTNNRMELTAAIEGLRATPSGTRILLRSDSQLLVKTINDGWKRNKNKDLWDMLERERIVRTVAFEWVRGHHIDPYNARADELAVNAARLALEQSSGDSGTLRSNARQLKLAPNVSAVRRPRLDLLRPATADARGERAEVVEGVSAMLRDGEMIARCTQCGREFVRRASEPSETACSLAACQFAARRQG